MHTLILEKTDKGRSEIATRAYQLTLRLRSLLLLVDGKTSNGELLKKLEGLGLTEVHLAALEAEGFIHPKAPIPEALLSHPATGITASASSQDMTSQEASDAMNQSPISESSANKLIAIQRFYNATIRETIGLKGIGLQLKVERAATLAEYRALRQPYLDAVSKSKGQMMAEQLARDLDRLLAE